MFNCKTAIVFALVSLNTAIAQQSYVIPPGFEEVEGDLFTGGYPEGFHFQQLAEADWFGDLPSGPQAIERISFRPKSYVEEPLDLQESQLTIKLSTTALDELGTVYADNHGPDMRTVFSGPSGIVSQNTSTNGITKDFDVHFNFDEPFIFDRSQGNLVFDLEYLPIAGEVIPDSLTDFTFANYAEVTGFGDTIHHVSNTGRSQPEAVQALPGGNIYQVTFADPAPTRQPIFTRKIDVGPVDEPNNFNFVPTVTSDGLTMFFSSDELPDENMYMSTRISIDEQFGNTVKLDSINSPANDDVGSVSADGLTLYFAADRDERGDWDMYTATRPSVDEEFGNVKRLPGPTSSPDTDDFSPRVSSDGLTMIYASNDGDDTQEPIALSDIWVASRTTENDEFGNPRRLDIGTDETEDRWASLSADGLVVVFGGQPEESGRPVRDGEGSEDIWVATRTSLDAPFSDAMNPDDVWPGSEINSAKRTVYPFLTPNFPEEGSQLYFVEEDPSTPWNPSIYQMTWMVPGDGDINLDGWEDVQDLDDMCAELRSRDPDLAFDIDGNGEITIGDMQLLQSRLDVLPGDVDLDGEVDFEDFLQLSDRFGRRSASATSWSLGADFDCSGETDFSDFLALSVNFGRSSEQLASVPEPDVSFIFALSIGVVAIVGRKRRRGN